MGIRFISKFLVSGGEVKKKGFALILILFTISCNRAQRTDQNYYSDQARPYSTPQGLSATQKIELMGQPRKRVVIFDFWNDTPIQSDEMGSFGAEELKRGLRVTQRVLVPEDVQTQLATRNFVQGDRVKVAQLIAEGRRMGVAVVVIGRIAKLIFRQRGDAVGLLRQKQSLAAADVELKIFDVAGGREIGSLGRSGRASANSMVAFSDEEMSDKIYRIEMSKFAVRDAVAQLVPNVIRSIEKLSWRGKIAKIIGTKVYVNAGRQSGIMPNDILKVLTSGDDVYDADSGAYLGHTQGHVKGTLEIVDFIGEDASVAVVHTGGQFSVGDIVQLY